MQAAGMPTHYDTLGAKRTAGGAEIKQAYRRKGAFDTLTADLLSPPVSISLCPSPAPPSFVPIPTCICVLTLTEWGK